MSTVRTGQTRLPGGAAFTLIEVLIVIAIISMLAGLTLGVSRAVIQEVYRKETLLMMKAVHNRIKQYRDERYEFPRASDGGSTSRLVRALDSLEGDTVEKTVGSAHFSGSMIVDAWGNAIRYYRGNSGIAAIDDHYVKMNRTPLLISLGADGEVGTSDDVWCPEP